MKVERDGKIYKVVDETENEYCVEAEFDFYPDTKRILRLWWGKKYCKIVKENEL